MANERARLLRKTKTKAETRLWWHLRSLKSRGWKFRQQAPIDRFIVDFVCLSERLAIEVDGATHNTPAEIAYDAMRERYLIGQGFRIHRVTNEDVRNNLAGVMDTIVHQLQPKGSLVGVPPPKQDGKSAEKASRDNGS